MTKKNILLLILIGIFNLCLTLHANASDYYYKKKGMFIDLGGRTDPLAIGGGIGLFGEIYDRLTLRTGLSFLGLENDYLYYGSNIGLRYRFGHRLSPFIGFGAFAGYSEKEVSAEDDNIDNDKDGFVDETGERKETIVGVIASSFPELGIHYWVTDKTRLTLSGQYHITTKGREYDFWLFSLGVSFF
jgi:hypothetical protein